TKIYPLSLHDALPISDHPHQSFAEGVRLRRPNRRSERRQTHRRQRSIHALRINAVAIVDQEAMRLVSRNKYSELLRRPVVGCAVMFQCTMRRVPTFRTTNT